MDEEIDATKVPSAFSEGKKAKIIAKNGPKIMKLPSYQPVLFKREIRND